MDSDDQRRSCPGFLDTYGIWNNGFECPSLPEQIRICCGSDSNRYCCSFEHLPTSSPSFSPTNETTLSFLKKINLTFLTLPVQLTFLFILILFFVLIIFLCYRSCQRKNHLFEREPAVAKQTLLMDHFPFSPPHHQVYFNDNHQQIKDTLTTSTSSSPRLPSEIYFNDWKEVFQPIEQSINTYPTRSIHNYDYRRHHGQYQQDEIIV